jgi:hypothetical protein
MTRLLVPNVSLTKVLDCLNSMLELHEIKCHRDHAD